MIIPLQAVPIIPATAWVAPNATLVGDVQLQEHTSIWYGAVLRADGDTILIGAGSNVQDLAIMHADPSTPVRIGRGVSVGHGAIVHGATIDDDVIVGMGACILTGAHIGAGTIIGAKALIPEGKVIPPRSLVVGIPGRVVRQLDDVGLAHIRQNATTYLTLSARHQAATAQLTE